MFERLLNLDVELRCLGTKAFVAKEQFVNDVFYSKPKKKKSDSEKSESKEDVNSLMEEIEEAKKEGKDTSELERKLKESMNKFLTSDKKEKEKPVTKEDVMDLMSKIQSAKDEGKDTSELEAELKAATEKFLATPSAKSETESAEKPAVCKVEHPSGSANAVDPTPSVTVGEGTTMDYSGQVQPGVTYTEPTVNPMNDELQKNPELQAAVEAAKQKSVK